MGIRESSKGKKMTYSFLFLIFALGSSEALKCLQCQSTKAAIDKDCVDGKVSKGMNCTGIMAQADGCTVNMVSEPEMWTRSCCKGQACLDADSDALGVWVYNESCKSDNCNTMDPRNGVSSALSVHALGLSVALMMALAAMI